MSTNAGSLLDIMRHRLTMQEKGITNPSSQIQAVTKQLVEKLSMLEPSEIVEIQILSESPLQAKYVLSSTQEILAEINEQ